MPKRGSRILLTQHYKAHNAPESEQKMLYSRKRITRQALSWLLTLALVVSMLGGLSITASARIGPDFVIQTGGEYQIDPGVIGGVITINTTDPVTLVGSGSSNPAIPTNEQLSIDCIVPGVQLTLDSLYIGSPYQQGNVLSFTGAGNTLTQAPGAAHRSILEADGFPNLTVIHVDPNTELTFLGSETSELYVYKNSGSSAIGGNTGEACGVINFNSGNVFAKGTGQGAVIGGNTSAPGQINGDISINGGQLSVLAMAMGAAIGSNGPGQCAGDVYINGGSTLINVDFAGSAIGWGGSPASTNGGDLYLNAGSLKTVVNWSAADSWNTPAVDTPTSFPITATIHYGETAFAANTVPVDIGSLSGNLDAVIYPRGLDAATAYHEVGFNQNTVPTVPIIPPATVASWVHDSSNTELYLGAPVTGNGGYISVTSGSTTQNYEYEQIAYPANLFQFVATLLPSDVNIVSFESNDSTVSVLGTPTTVTTVEDGGSVSFTVTPDAGFVVNYVSVDGNWITADAQGVYTLTNITQNTSVLVYTYPTWGLNHVDFVPNGSTIRVGGQFVTEAEMAISGTLLFDVVLNPAVALDYVSVSPTGTITHVGGETYQLSGVTGPVTVTVHTHQIPSFPLYFNLTNAQALVNGIAVAQTQIQQVAGEFLFEIVPDFGYTYNPANVSATGATLQHVEGYLFQLINPTSAVTVTLPISTPVSGFWSATSGGTWTGGGTESSPYVISNALGLARLMREVNAGTDHSGHYFTLSANIDLSTYEWVPIGGTHNLTIEIIPAPIAGTNAFRGNFDGAGHTISGINMNIPATNNNAAGFGLFGYVDGGTISNLTVSGTIDTDQTINAVGGVVGYTTGNLTNLVNEVALTISNLYATQTGGIAGVVNSTRAVPVLVQNSANVVNLEASSRFGGIVGATYRENSGCGLVTIDACFNTGNLYNADANGRTHIGGIVGLDMGVISNCYNMGDIHSGAITLNLGGIAGTLNGQIGIASQMFDVYNIGTLTGPNARNEFAVQPLFSSADHSSEVLVSNSVYTQGAQNAVGATMTNVLAVSDAYLRSQSVLSTLATGAFAQYASTYPVLTWQTITLPAATIPNLNTAMAAATPAINTIVVNGTIPVGIGANLTIDIGEKGAQIVRGTGAGNLFNMAGTGNLTVLSGVIDGTISGAPTTGTVVNMATTGTGSFTLTPTVDEPFQISGIINLTGVRNISVGATLANIDGELTITKATPSIGSVVATAVSGHIFDNSDLARFVYSGGGHTFQLASGGAQITLAS